MKIPKQLALCLALLSFLHCDAQTTFVDSIGVDTHLTQGAYSNTAQVMALLQQLGVHHVRDGTPDPTWTADFQHIGLLTNGGIGYTSSTDLRTPGLNPITPAVVAQIEAQATFEAFEGPNEYDVSGAPLWIQKLLAYTQALYSSVGGTRSVVGPSMAHAYNYGRLGNLEQWLDYGNLHIYWGASPPEPGLQTYIAEVRKAVPTKPIVVTETGYHNALATPLTGGWEPVDETTAAKYLLRELFTNYAAGITRTFVYELMSRGTDPTLTVIQNEYGLVRADGTLKPAFIAIQATIAAMGDAAGTNGSMSLSIAGIRSMEFVKSNGHSVVVLWQAVPSWNATTKQEIPVAPMSVQVEAPFSATYAQLTDPMTGTKTALTAGSSFTVPVNDYPVILEIGAQ